MESTSYPIKGYYKKISLFGIIVSILAAVLNFATGNPIAFVMLFVAVVSYFQYQWACKSFIELNGTVATIRITWIITKTVDLAQLKQFEIPKKKRMVLHPKEGNKVTVHLGMMPPEVQERAVRDITAIVNGTTSNDFVEHLIVED